MSAPGNEHLYAARVSKGWFSQERAAEGISCAGRTELRDTTFTVSVRTYRRWETPAPPWPRPDYATALRAAFDRGPEYLGFRPPGGRCAGPSGPAAAEPVMIPPVNRREALATGAAALGLPWLAPGDSGRRRLRVGHEEIEGLRATALDLDAIDQRFGGDRLWRSARSHLSWVHHLIDQGSYPDEVGLELQGLAGELTTSLGWFCYDADQQAEARVYFSEALNTAMLAGNDVLATRTLSNMARQSVDLGKPREAVRFARVAQGHAARWQAPPRVSALLAVREAQGYARMGNELACSTAVKRAWQLFAQGTGDRDPDWVAFLNEAELTCLEGMCRLDLGQFKRSVRLLERSAELQDIEHSRNRGMCLARLSYAALRDRDLDRTVAAAQESLRLIQGGMTSSRNRRQLELVRDGLGPHHLIPEVRHTAEQLTAHTA
ncbi:hypothetical protein ACIRPK_00685 [Kitasatospora sp. NPDC101801]|uniref:hypothetical protein n=1 Tax=Kitasatospora sp. NPDC101801 TaxID=3364103 RepID=UPI003805333B